MTNLKQGENMIMVNAVDDAGNSAEPLSTTITVFSYTASGAFVIGDVNSATGSSVTFWGSQWSKKNTLSGGTANASFKGFADALSSNPPACGSKWTASTGASSRPPASIPDYMAVIVSDKITKTGNTISGDIKEIVIVKTAPGYQPAPAYPGMGTVVGTLCRNNSQMSLVSINTFPSLEGRDKGRVKPLLLASVGSTSQLLNSSTTTEALYFYHTDHLGTPIMMTDSSGQVVWSGEFLPFGEPFSITGTVTNNLRFPGQYFDEETGLHQNWHRDYRSGTGTYIERDPIGFKGGDVNLFRYAKNNPIMFNDPSGESVSLCQRALSGLPFRFGPFHHAYINLDGFIYGFHPEGSLYSNGRVALEPLGTDIKCGEPLKCVDEGCVNSKILATYANPPNYSFGFFDCRAWAKMILLSCHKKDCCE